MEDSEISDKDESGADRLNEEVVDNEEASSQVDLLGLKKALPMSNKVRKEMEIASSSKQSSKQTSSSNSSSKQISNKSQTSNNGGSSGGISLNKKKQVGDRMITRSESLREDRNVESLSEVDEINKSKAIGCPREFKKRIDRYKSRGQGSGDYDSRIEESSEDSVNFPSRPNKKREISVYRYPNRTEEVEGETERDNENCEDIDLSENVGGNISAENCHEILDWALKIAKSKDLRLETMPESLKGKMLELTNGKDSNSDSQLSSVDEQFNKRPKTMKSNDRSHKINGNEFAAPVFKSKRPDVSAHSLKYDIKGPKNPMYSSS